MGPKRENQNLPSAGAKASGSQFKKLPLTAAALECPTPGCSTAKEEVGAAVTPPKISLKKSMKKSLTKIPTTKGSKSKKLKIKKKKSEKALDKLSSNK